MPTPSPKRSDKVKTLAIALQRQKTAMETGGLQERYWDVYWKLSEAIWSLEKAARIDAPALRDEEDERLRAVRSEVPND